MIYDGPNHRGCHLASETAASRRKYFKKGLRVSLTAYYDQWKASNEAQELAQAETDRQAEAAFLLECDRVKYSRCHASKIPFHLIQEAYKTAHPRAKLQEYPPCPKALKIPNISQGPNQTGLPWPANGFSTI